MFNKVVPVSRGWIVLYIFIKKALLFIFLLGIQLHVDHYLSEKEQLNLHGEPIFIWAKVSGRHNKYISTECRSNKKF